MLPTTYTHKPEDKKSSGLQGMKNIWHDMYDISSVRFCTNLVDRTSQDEENCETRKETEKCFLFCFGFFLVMYSTLHIDGVRKLSYNCALMLKSSNFSC